MLNLIQATFLGTVLEGVFYGIYCIVFVLYIRVHTSKKCVNKNLLIYPISTLFILCTAFFACDFTQQYITVANLDFNLVAWNLNTTTSVFYSFIDVIAQGVLIYRCWVVWGRKLAVIVVPSILSFVSLATSLTLAAELAVLGPAEVIRPAWFDPVGILSFCLSLAVNTIFTGLLVFKIAKSSMALRNTHTRGIQDLTPLISMLIESGLVLFLTQLIWLVTFSLETSVFNLVSGPVAMIYGIIPTTIVVRVALAGTTNKSTHNKSSNVESNMEFAFDDNLTKRNSSQGPGDSKGTVV
jgi:hypothetical protein